MEQFSLTMNPPEEYCFPQMNNSCRKIIRTYLETSLVYTVLSCITVLTVVLNLLVIISITHFRQLHTTTNFLLLSLAVADFLVGFIQMPLEILLYRGCFNLGDFICVMNNFFAFLFISVSVGCMVLISVDRYMAICDPLLYSTKVTPKRVNLSICLCWIFSAFHASWILRDLLKQPDIYYTCYGECFIELTYVEGAFDFVVTFCGPIIVILVLYIRVFVVALSQAQAMKSHNADIQHSNKVTARKSEIKAARNLGVVVAVFLVCSCPYYFYPIAGQSEELETSTPPASYSWVLYFNSCLNPVIYALFYPWFRKSIKHIVTLQTLKRGSCRTNIL